MPLFKQDHAKMGLDICLGSQSSGFIHFKNPVPSLALCNVNAFMSHIYYNLLGGSVMIKHRERNLFLTLTNLTLRNKVMMKCKSVIKKISANKVKKERLLQT